ncbi:MAG: M24 family metallopeptidase, partial [Anaerotignum sp.]
LFSIPQEVGVEKVWYADTDDVMEMVASYIDHTVPLGVDKDLKARFLLPLMEQKAATAFVNTSLAVDTVRGIKDREEQEKMHLSSQINDRAMGEFKKLIHAGVTEKEVAEQMLGIYLRLGAEGFSFAPLVAFGANAADPHHSPNDTVLKEGDVVLFDVGCIKDGYCSDMTRSFFYKTVSEKHREIYETVRAANERAIAKIKPGVPLMELDLTARSLITEKGYGPNFNHRLGHFIGLSEHEFGDVSSVNATPAVPGMVFSIEPGIYIVGDTGVRVEDLVLVTEDGCEVLNQYPKELEIIE